MRCAEPAPGRFGNRLVEQQRAEDRQLGIRRLRDCDFVALIIIGLLTRSLLQTPIADPVYAIESRSGVEQLHYRFVLSSACWRAFRSASNIAAGAAAGSACSASGCACRSAGGCDGTGLAISIRFFFRAHFNFAGLKSPIRSRPRLNSGHSRADINPV